MHSSQNTSKDSIEESKKLNLKCKEELSTEIFSQAAENQKIQLFFEIIQRYCSCAISLEELMQTTQNFFGPQYVDALRWFLRTNNLEEGLIVSNILSPKEEKSLISQSKNKLIMEQDNVLDDFDEEALFDPSSVLLSLSKHPVQQKIDFENGANETPVEFSHRKQKKKIDDDDDDWETEETISLTTSRRSKRSLMAENSLLEAVDTTTCDVFQDINEGKKRPRSKSYEFEYDFKKQKTNERSNPDRWTKEEDMRLLEIVRKEFGMKEPNNWNLIADKLGSKTGNQCFQHWKRVLNPNIKKGPFTLDEEEILIAKAKQHGTRIPWSKVAEALPGRTDTQCRYQYLQRMKNHKIAWTSEEDQVLLSISKELKPLDNAQKWQRLSDELSSKLKKASPARSPLECKQRLITLHAL